MSEFSPAGITIDNLEEIFEALIADFRTFYGDNIKTEPKSNFGGLGVIWSEAVVDQNELIEAVVSAHSPGKATGVFLSELVAFNGITRNEAEFTIVNLNLIANSAGSTIPADSIVSDPVTGRKVLLDSEAILAPSEVKLVSFTAELPGPDNFEVNTLTKIETPVYGWESATNPAIGTPGQNEETDTELRARRWLAATKTASTNDTAIYTAIADLQEATDVKVHSNKTPTIDGLGVPPGQIWSIVEGASDADIAKAIFDHTSAGIGWYGAVIFNYVDPVSSEDYDIKFSRPDNIAIYIIANLTKNPEYGEYPGDGDEQVEQNILDYFDQFQRLSIDVSSSRLYTPVNLVQGHTIDSLLIGTAPAPTTDGDIPMTLNEKAVTDADKITVNS